MESKRIMFSNQERSSIIELVNKHKHVLENKKSDCVSAAHKKVAWKTLTEQFNSLPDTTNRTTDQLKKCWENIKSRRRKELAEAKRETFKTGGGKMPELPKDDPPLDDVLADVDIEIKDAIDSDTQIEVLQPIPGPSCINKNLVEISNVVELEELDVDFRTPKTPGKNKTFMSRGKAIEEELQARLDRNNLLQIQDEEFHALRMEEQQLKIIEQKIRIEQAEISKKILLEQHEQEKLKTEILRKSNK